jgi:DNA-binding NtrC family response regulator
MARVLVVDDDDDLRQSVGDWLTRDGHVVDLAAGVNEALALMESLVPDVLLTDFAMAPHTGEVLLRAVAARHPRVRRIVYTAASDEETRGAREAAHAVLSKSCEMSEVSATIWRCLQMRHAC